MVREQQWSHREFIFLCAWFYSHHCHCHYGVTIPYMWHESGEVAAWNGNSSINSKNQAHDERPVQPSLLPHCIKDIRPYYFLCSLLLQTPPPTWLCSFTRLRFYGKGLPAAVSSDDAIFCAKMAATVVDIKYQWICCALKKNTTNHTKDYLCACDCVCARVCVSPLGKKVAKVMPKIIPEFSPLIWFVCVCVVVVVC